MRALVLYEHGGNDKFRFETDFPTPTPGPGELLVQVRATSLNHHDVFTRRGMPGINLRFPLIVGCDVAGEIVALGDGVDDWAIGDRVLFDPINRTKFEMIGETRPGGLADYIAAPAHQALRIPDDISFETAACLPMAYATAYRMMVTRGAVGAGERVVILGASGGVGTACVQIAKMNGAEVVACAGSDASLERLTQLGADHGINYRAAAFHEEVIKLFGKPNVFGTGGGADVIVNCTGGDTWVQSMKCLAKNGRMLTCGATAGYDPKTDLRYIWSFEHTIIGSNGWLRSDIEALIGHVQHGKITPVIGHVARLEDAASAMEMLDARTGFGKIVVKP